MVNFSGVVLFCRILLLQFGLISIPRLSGNSLGSLVGQYRDHYGIYRKYSFSEMSSMKS